MKSKLGKLFINISIYIIIFFIVFSISMLVIMNNLEASDENFPYGTIVIGEEKTIIYSFLNIPMKEESIVFNEDGSFDTESINYPIYTMAPFVISLVLTTVIFLIISLIRSRKNPHKHKKREQFLFEWTFKD